MSLHNDEYTPGQDPETDLAIAIISTCLEDISLWQQIKDICPPRATTSTKKSQREKWFDRQRDAYSALIFLFPTSVVQRDWTEGLFYLAGYDPRRIRSWLRSQYNWVEDYICEA